MDFKLDYNVISFLGVVLVLLMIVIALKAKATRFIKLVFQLASRSIYFNCI